MRQFFENRWWIALAAVAVVAIAVLGKPQTLTFQADLLSKVMPSLLAGLVAIAAVMERAVAVLNDIWFGEEREQKEETVRLSGKALGAARADFRSASATHADLVKNAIQANSQLLAEGSTALTTVAAQVTELDAKVASLADQLKEANADLAATEGKVDRARLGFAFVIALVVSALGVRTLETMFQVGITSEQLDVFHAVDILLTAGLLAGGTSGISAIADLLGSYLSASRKRALENS